MTRIQFVKFSLPLVILLFGASCSSKEVDRVPVNKTLIVSTGSNVNQHADVAYPVVIRLYQLSSRTEFQAASFWAIFNTSESLAGVVIDKRSLSPLYPDEKRLVAIDLEEDTFFLGVFAEFAEYKQQAYSDVVPISADILDEGVTVTVTSSGVAIKVARKKGLFESITGLFSGGDK